MHDTDSTQSCLHVAKNILYKVDKMLHGMIYVNIFDYSRKQNSVFIVVYIFSQDLFVRL